MSESICTRAIGLVYMSGYAYLCEGCACWRVYVACACAMHGCRLGNVLRVSNAFHAAHGATNQNTSFGLSAKSTTVMDISTPR